MTPTFDHLWQLLANHGSSDRRRLDAFLLWDKLTPDRRQQLYDRIASRLRHNRFVHYDPVHAIIDNTPPPEPRVLTYGEYYSRYRTTEPKDGWQMTKNADGHVCYIK